MNRSSTSLLRSSIRQPNIYNGLLKSGTSNFNASTRLLSTLNTNKNQYRFSKTFFPNQLSLSNKSSRQFHVSRFCKSLDQSSTASLQGDQTQYATEINFSADPFSESTLQARIAKYITTSETDVEPLTDTETLNVLRAITVDFGSFAATKLGLSDSEILPKQYELLKSILNNETARNRLVLTPNVLRPLFLDLVNKEYRFGTTIKPGASMGPWEVKEQQKKNEEGENGPLTPEILSTTDLVIEIIKAYNRKYANSHDARKAVRIAHENSVDKKEVIPFFIPIPVAMIPFRRAVYNGELDKAFEIIDVTAGSKNYLKTVKNKWISFGTKWVLGTTTVLGGVHFLLHSGLVGTWNSTTGILFMVFAYICNTTVLAGLAFSGRVSNSGEYVKWIPGTLTTYWYTHAQEMKMASLIAAVDRALPENQDEPSFRVKKLLEARRMMAVEAEQEYFIKEYWARGGEGFEWVEPDQDPAEIVWRSKMEATKAKRIASQAKYGEKYKWADQALPTNSLPHASLTNIPPPSSSPKELPGL